MSDSPKVSVVLPTYNRADLLPSAIDSVLAQTYSAWELVVWDDGSTDNTQDLVRSFVDDRVKYLHGDNCGAAFARNRAIGASHGEYIAFLDSDDEWLSGKLSTQIGILESNEHIDVVFGNFLNRDLSTGREDRWFDLKAHALRGLQTEHRGSVSFITGGMPELLMTANFIATDAVVLRKRLLDSVGCFNESLRNSEDLELWWRMSLFGARFAYVTEDLLIRNWLPSGLARQSVAACENEIKGLDCCSRAALARGRTDLLPYLNGAYRRRWRNLMRQQARSGDKRATLRAFRGSMRYGISRSSLIILARTMMGRGAGDGR